MRKVEKKVCKLSLFSQLSAPIKSGVTGRTRMGVIRSGLDSLGLTSLTSEALLSAMTWLAVHKMRSQVIWADSYVWWNDAFWLRVKERCPKKWLMISVWLSPRCPPSLSASRPSHTDSTCLILAHHSLTRLRWPVISWFDHRRFQASKTSDKHGQPKATPVVCSHAMTFSIPKLLTRSQAPGTANQSYMPRPSSTCRLFPDTKSMSYMCTRYWLSTSCNAHVYLATTRLYPLHLLTRFIHFEQHVIHQASR